MATIQEVYEKVMASAEERLAFAKAAGDDEALAAFLVERGCEAGVAEAKAYVASRRTGELSDEELDSVSGGCGGSSSGSTTMPTCPLCGRADSVTFAGFRNSDEQTDTIGNWQVAYYRCSSCDYEWC